MITHRLTLQASLSQIAKSGAKYGGDRGQEAFMESEGSAHQNVSRVAPYRKNSNGVGLLPTNTGSDGI
jgi:hypothetical protein